MNRGFVSLNFLIGFLQITLLTATMMLQIQAQLTVLEQMKAVHHAISLEARLIDEVNCRLENDTSMEEPLVLDGREIFLWEQPDRIEVVGLKEHPIYLRLNEARKRVAEIEWE